MKKLYNLHKALFEGEAEEYLFPFRDEWYPTKLEWKAMINNLNNHSKLDNIFKRMMDQDKVVRYFFVARAIEWPNFEEYFNTVLYEKMRRLGLHVDEIDLIVNENVPIPDPVVHMLNDYEKYDKLGGISLRHQDLGVFADDQILFKALGKLNNAKEYTFMRLPLDYSKVVDNIRIIKIEFNNGSLAYVRIDKVGANCYHFKTRDGERRNAKGDSLGTQVDLYLGTYDRHGGIVDDDYTINWL